jgi:hypothetical protein
MAQLTLLSDGVWRRYLACCKNLLMNKIYPLLIVPVFMVCFIGNMPAATAQSTAYYSEAVLPAPEH